MLGLGPQLPGSLSFTPNRWLPLHAVAATSVLCGLPCPPHSCLYPASVTTAPSSPPHLSMMGVGRERPCGNRGDQIFDRVERMVVALTRHIPNRRSEAQEQGSGHSHGRWWRSERLSVELSGAPSTLPPPSNPIHRADPPPIIFQTNTTSQSPEAQGPPSVAAL